MNQSKNKIVYEHYSRLKTIKDDKNTPDHYAAWLESVMKFLIQEMIDNAGN